MAGPGDQARDRSNRAEFDGPCAKSDSRGTGWEAGRREGKATGEESRRQGRRRANTRPMHEISAAPAPVASLADPRAQ
ncbi:hypothetical protein CALCODRAFT_181350 [Calocera cornea HHB12733]|uniref:Uncharacterized protein n=1 Tax=Calocera cornea HHB12733 TaxID=1353952 RepID=A0A165HRJ3_9BASI|nr:hypothetical protein CALCODRAFT_181350 [Calocera cornea HHB12733]